MLVLEILDACGDAGDMNPKHNRPKRAKPMRRMARLLNRSDSTPIGALRTDRVATACFALGRLLLNAMPPPILQRQEMAFLLSTALVANDAYGFPMKGRCGHRPIRGLAR